MPPVGVVGMDGQTYRNKLCASPTDVQSTPGAVGLPGKRLGSTGHRAGALFQAFRHHGYLEALIWIGGLLYLAMINPGAGGHFNLCILRILGFEYCPGCGLGRAVSYMLHGDFLLSWQTHPLGGVAVVILIGRVFSIAKRSINRTGWST